MTSQGEITAPPAPQKSRVSTRHRLLILGVGWLLVLMPFLFWRGTWFGRSLSDSQLASYLRDEQKPRHMQHALVQMGERMARGERVDAWYPEVLRLSQHPTEEIRNTAAWIMGQDTSRQDFHEALLRLLNDPSHSVRSNAALALVRFGDDSGRRQIVSMLQPVNVAAPVGGKVTAIGKAGGVVGVNAALARIEADGTTHEVRAPMKGRIRSVEVASGASVQAGDSIVVLNPDAEMIWEALRALYVVGKAEDLDALRPYLQGSREIPERIRQQAEQTARAIQSRSSVDGRRSTATSE